MPYVVREGAVYKKSGKLVGRSKNPKKYKRVLDAIHHGWRPTKKKR